MRIPTTSQFGSPEPNFRESPLEQVRTLFVRFVQGLFHAAPLGAYHWEPDLESTELIVTDENPIKVEGIGQRPAITFTRGPIQFYSLGLDDLLAYNQATGQKQKSVLVPGTMTINCCSRVDLEAERLAWIIAEQLWANRELLLKVGFFEIGRQPAIGSPSPAGSIIAGDNGDEWYVVSVTCPYQFYRTTSITPLGGQVLQGIDINLSAVANAGVSSCGPAGTDNGEYPTFVEGCPPASFAPDASDINGHTPNPGYSAPVLPLVPHPLNPSQMVTVRTVRPTCSSVRSLTRSGKSIPLSSPIVEESCGKQTNSHVTAVTKTKV